MQRQLTEATLQAHLLALSRVDPDIARALARVGPPALRQSQPGLTSLLRVIVGQQVSVKAAASIWSRLAGAFDPFTAEALARARLDRLRRLGLSRQKADYTRSLARLVASRALDLEGIAGAEDEAAIEALVQARGVGRWTAEVYLLFALGRADIWPADDLGIAEGLRRLKGWKERRMGRELRDFAEGWRPYRSAAAHLMWHYLHKTPV
jgi:DNA-3-methyladenine glycosylase II